METGAWPFLPSETPQGQSLFQSSPLGLTTMVFRAALVWGSSYLTVLAFPSFFSHFRSVPWSEGFSGLLLLPLTFVFSQALPLVISCIYNPILAFDTNCQFKNSVIEMRPNTCHIHRSNIGLFPEPFFRKKSHLISLCCMQQVHLKQIYLMVEYKVVNKGKCKQKAEVMILISD